MNISGHTATLKRTRSSDPIGEGRVRQLIAENSRLERTLHNLNLGIDAHSIVAITDPRGIILEVNDKFVELSKYPRAELIGAPQSIVKSGRHPESFYVELWQTIARGNVWQGTICNRAKDGTEYWVATTIVPLKDGNDRIERYLSIRTDITQLYIAEQRVRDLAYLDQLTGLPNRAMMLTHLSTRARTETDELRVYITAEFEGLGMMNETFGFAVADHLLGQVAERLNALSYVDSDEITGSPLDRQPDLIARIGSSTFAAEFGGFSTNHEVAKLRMRTLAEQFGTMLISVMRSELGSTIEPRVRASFVEYRPGGDLDGADVYTRAEAARHHSAQPVRGGPVVAAEFEQATIDSATRRSELVLGLRRGASSGCLRLFLQPVVAADRSILGYEGLLRWADPDYGVVQPDEFIALAERTGMIVEIGEWVLDEACRILAEWAKHPETRDYTISVNVSERQLRPDALVNSLRQALARHGARADRLKLEVTESTLHVDLSRSIDVLNALRSEGVQLSLDDFGTGYSSLNHLSSLPVQQLKIDRSFIAPIAENPIDASIVSTIVDLAHALNLEVIAEGVETEAQLEVLTRFGISGYQGFLFGKPEPHTI